MIQRIQTLYLFVVTVLTALMMFMPVAGFSTVGGAIDLKMCGFVHAASGEMLSSAWGLAVTIAAAALLPLLTIFLYNRRLLQFRLCIVEMVLLCGVLLFEVLYMWLGYSKLNDFPLTAALVKLPALFPVFSLIFTWLALRGIKKDILLVKSLDRIR